MNSRPLLPVKAIVPVILLLAGLGCLFSGSCRKEPEIYQVGILSGADTFAEIAAGFRTGLTNQGLLEGERITYDIRRINVDPMAEQEIAREFVKTGVDLIFAFPTSAAVAARNAAEGTGIPVVFANANIEGNHLVQDLRLPGGSITGVRYPASETTLKRLEFLLEFQPEANRIHLCYDRNYPGIDYTLISLRRTAILLKLQLVEVPVLDLEGLVQDLNNRSRTENPGIDAILIMPTPLSAGPQGFPLLNRFALEHNIPLGGSTVSNAQAGALFGYIPDNLEMGLLAAHQAAAILKGKSAGTIPVITPEAYLYINYDTIERLGLTVKENLLIKAARIFRSE